jgi:hypothetical protein
MHGRCACLASAWPFGSRWAFVVVLFQLKLLVLGALIFVGLKLLRLDGIGLCVGLSILPLSIVVRAIKWGMSAPVSHGDLVKHG